MALAVQHELVQGENLFDFFHERVETAKRHQRAPVSDNAVFYLSSLLAEQGKRSDEAAEGPSTLVEMRERAANSSFAESVTWWKRIGDSALVGVGYFREHLLRRRISPEYYARMGEGAYGVLSRMLRRPGDDDADIFGELSARFSACTEVIAEVRDDARDNNATDLVRLYEEWLQTGSPRVAERLRQLGVVPVRFGGDG